MALKTLLGIGESPYAPKADVMLLYVLSKVDVRAQWLETQGAIDAAGAKILEDVRRRLDRLGQAGAGSMSEDAAWTEMYGLERRMALLEPKENLLQELRLRLDQAAAEAVPAEPRLRLAFAAAEFRALDQSKTPPVLNQSEIPNLRALLLEVLEQTHWTLQRKFFGRPIHKSVIRRIVGAGLFSFSLFVLPYAWIYANAYRTGSGSSYFGQGAIYSFTALPLWTTLTAGLFGAYFSRLLFVQQNANRLSLGEVRSAREWTSIFLRGSVGMCGALIVFFFLRSGIISGQLFPDFTTLGVGERDLLLREPLEMDAGAGAGAGSAGTSLRLILPSPSLALLAVWCFLAGFSERLVPSILSSTEQKLDSAAQGTSKTPS